MRNLLREAQMPTSRRALVLLRFAVGKQQRQLEGVRQGNELELGGGGERLRDVRAVKGSAEAREGGALRPSQTHVPIFR